MQGLFSPEVVNNRLVLTESCSDADAGEWIAELTNLTMRVSKSFCVQPFYKYDST